jgi:hypothetical protein
MAYSMRQASPFSFQDERLCPDPTGEGKKFQNLPLRLRGTNDAMNYQ